MFNFSPYNAKEALKQALEFEEKMNETIGTAEVFFECSTQELKK